jgi:ABC-type Mn2+/Zn2+ transport system permease subunit
MTFKQYLKKMIPSIACFALSLIILILHQSGINWEFTSFGQTTTLSDLGLVILCMGFVFALMVMFTQRYLLKSVDNKDTEVK